MLVHKEINDLEEFDAWSGAVEVKDHICNEGGGQAFMKALEDVYPHGISETALNDLLWFSPEYCYVLAGVDPPSE